MWTAPYWTTALKRCWILEHVVPPAHKRDAGVRATSITTASVLDSKMEKFQKVSRTLWILEVQSAPARREVEGSVAILFHALRFPLTALNCRNRRMDVFNVSVLGAFMASKSMKPVTPSKLTRVRSAIVQTMAAILCALRFQTAIRATLQKPGTWR